MRHLSKYILFALLIELSFIESSLIASAAPSPEQELQQTEKEIQQAKERQSALAEETQKLQEELKSLQEKLVKTAEATQKTEAESSETEEHLRILTQQAKDKDETLKAQKQRLSSLLMAELSLSATPPEAMLMMPEDPLEIMKAARALSMASDSIRQETLTLSRELAELNTLKASVAERREQLAQLQATLDKQRHEVETQVADRTALQKKLGLEEKQEEAALSKMAKKSSDLKELVTGIEKEEARKEENKHRAGHMRSFADAQGHIRTPVAGQMVQRFGASQGKNATSKGINIATRPGAEVTAPYDGEVVFTGPFLNYGQMIIIRHSDDFHTLLAGLAKIDVEVGQFLLEGEPIGAMGDSDSQTKNQHTLYVEIRKDNQPVDPADWIGGLKKMNR